MGQRSDRLLEILVGDQEPPEAEHEQYMAGAVTVSPVTPEGQGESNVRVTTRAFLCWQCDVTVRGVPWSPPQRRCSGTAPGLRHSAARHLLRSFCSHREASGGERRTDTRPPAAESTRRAGAPAARRTHRAIRDARELLESGSQHRGRGGEASRRRRRTDARRPAADSTRRAGVPAAGRTRRAICDARELLESGSQHCGRGV